MTAPAPTSGGGVTSPIRRGDRKYPASIITIPDARVRNMVEPTVRLSFSRSFAPKNWADRMDAPVATPIKRTNSKFMMGPAVPTAARAVSPM